MADDAAARHDLEKHHDIEAFMQTTNEEIGRIVELLGKVMERNREYSIFELSERVAAARHAASSNESVKWAKNKRKSVVTRTFLQALTLAQEDRI